MSRFSWLSLVFTTSAIAAPIPKLDPETERIHKLFGTITEPIGAKLSLDAKNILTVKLDKSPPPKKKNADPKQEPADFDEYTGVSFTRKIQGEFTATLQFQLKTDLLQRPENTGVSVGLRVEYPSGAQASLNADYHRAQAYTPPDQPERFYLAVGVGSFVVKGDKNDLGMGKSGGRQTPASGSVRIRIRGVGKKLHLEHQPDGKKWEEYDSVELKNLGEGQLSISVMSFHKAETEILLEKLEVK